jgi:uncharacterized protein YheU (UPF0270 family)
MRDNMSIKLKDILEERLESDLWRRGGDYGIDLTPLAEEVADAIDLYKEIDITLYKAARSYQTSRSTEVVQAYFLDVQNLLKRISRSNASIRKSINNLVRSRGRTY